MGGFANGLERTAAGKPPKNRDSRRTATERCPSCCAKRATASLWAGTYGEGLWRLNNGQLRLFTTADGLSSNQIRSLVEDTDGTLWIGTFGGGLDALRDGQFYSHYR